MAINLYKGVDAQADLARRRSSKQESVNLGQNKEAMARRAAQLGGGPSGALMKQDTLAENASAERLQAANEGIESSRMAEHGRIAGVLQGQEFQRGERLGAQKWQSGEAASQRKWGTSERLGGQQFTASQNAAQIKAQFDMQAAQIKAAADEGKLNRAQAQAQLDELTRQYNIDTAANKQTNTINTILSANNSGLKPDVIGKLLAALGIDVGDIEGLTVPKTQPANTGGGPAPLPPGLKKFHNGRAANPGWAFDADGNYVKLEE